MCMCMQAAKCGTQAIGLQLATSTMTIPYEYHSTGVFAGILFRT